MDCNNLADLLGEVHSQVDILQKSIAQVGQVKASLKTTASEVKSQIRDSVSRHLEALRNRETWLLGQVEVVQHIKEDMLRQQQAELNKALGRLQSTCFLLEQSSKALDTDSLKCRVKESLESVGQLNLIPEETNTINFVARNFELQDSIHKYGVVVSDNPFADKQMVSSCERLKLSSGKKVAFFTPSGSCEDWLMKSTDTANACQDVPKSHAVTFNIQDWLQPKEAVVITTTESSITSVPEQTVENWLAKCQSHDAVMDTEDEQEAPGKSFAVAENKAAEIQSWLMKSHNTSSAAAMPPANLFDYYRVVKLSESSKWLKSNAGSAKDKLSTNLIGETYHKIAASSPGEWLIQRKLPVASSSRLMRSISTQSCSECSCGLSSVCCDADAQEESDNFDDTSSEFSDWLAVKKVDTSSRGTLSDRRSTKVADNDTWLMKQHGKFSRQIMDVTGIKKYRENLAAQSNECWLKHKGPLLLDNEKDGEGITSGMKSYIDSLPVDYKQWLSNPPADSGLCKWLARRSSEKCKECPRMCSKGLFKVFDEVSSSNDGWLMSQELY